MARIRILVPLLLASLVAAPVLGSLPASAAPAGAPRAAGTAGPTATSPGGPQPTSIVRSGDAETSTVLVHGLGDAETESTRENRRFRHSDLQPTGRFATKGQELVVTIPEGAPAMQLGVGLYGVYAAHNGGTDVGITKTALKPGVNTIQAPVDGMVSLISTAPTGSAQVEVRGGQAVPTFIKGQTSQAAFVADLDRFADAPFIEVIADRMFGDFQTRSAAGAIRADDLEKRMTYWDEVVVLTNETYGLLDDATGTARKAAHRLYIASADSSGGYANAGAGRLMFHVSTKADTDLFRYGTEEGWALWHEIGHTYQNPSYLYDGSSEVTVNISALAVQIAMGEPLGTDDPRWQAELAHFFSTPIESREFDTLGIGLELQMFDQLRKGFGPAFFAHLHQEIRVRTVLSELPADNNAERFQALALSAARVADRDLRPFFEQWGFPLSAATRAAMADLPPLTAKIWDNRHSSKPIVDHELPSYSVPVGAVSAVAESVTVGRERLDSDPQVSGLGNSDPSVAAHVVDSRVKARSVGTGVGAAQVVVSNDHRVREVLTTPLDVTAGNSLQLLGQQNRTTAFVALDSRSHDLRFLAGTGYQAHSNWAGREYLAVLTYAPDGRLINTDVVNGDENARRVELTADKRPYVNGQFLVIRHQQASDGLLHYIDGKLQSYRPDKERAFQIVDDRFVSVPMASIPACDASCTPALTGPDRAEVGATVTVEASRLVPGEHVRISVAGDTADKSLTVSGSGTVTTEIPLTAAGAKRITLEATISRVSLSHTVLVGDDSALEPELRPLVFEPTSASGTDERFTGVALSVETRSLTASAATSRDEARKAAATARMPLKGATGAIELPGNLCLVPSISGGVPIVGIAGCDGSPAQRWQVGSDGTLRSLDPAAEPQQWWSQHGESGVVERGASASVRLAESPVAVTPVSAQIGTVYNDVRWAQISGTATPGSEIRVGDQKVATDPSSGFWRTTVKGLATGANTLVVEQFLGGLRADSVEVTVTIGDAGDASMVAVDADPVVLLEGASTKVPFVLLNSIQRISLTASIEVTAPAGTTFAPGQTALVAEYQNTGSSTWSDSSRGTLKNGTLSPDAKTMRFDLDWSGSTTNFDPGMKLRWSPVVVTPAGAQRADAAMRFVVSDPRPTVGFHVDAQARVEINPPGLIPGPAPRVELTRRGTTEVPVVITNVWKQTQLAGTVEFTAPKSTVFPATSTVAAYYQYNGGSWTRWSTLDLKNGTLSADGTKLSFTFDTGPKKNLRADESYRFILTVTTPDEARGSTSSLGYDFRAATDSAQFRVASAVPTHLDGDTSPFTVDSHHSGDTYREGVTVFGGVGTPGARVVATNQWGTTMGSAAVDSAGSWSFARNLGPTSSYVITFAHTDAGQVDSERVELFFAATLDVSVLAPADGSTYAEGPATFRGKGAPNAAISAVNQWGTVMGRTTVALDGTWSFSRTLGPTSDGYDVTVSQTKAGLAPSSASVHLDFEAAAAPLIVMSHRDGDGYRPGVATFTGTATPGAAIVAANQWGTVMGRTLATSQGDWSFERQLGPTTDGYTIDFSATHGSAVERATLTLLPE